MDEKKELEEPNIDQPITFDFDINPDDLYLVGDSVIDQKGLISHHLESANNFYKNGLKNIITQGFKIEKDIVNRRSATAEDKDIERIHCEVIPTSVKLTPPDTLQPKTGQETVLYPKVAFARDKNYCGSLYIGCDIKAVAYYKNGNTLERTDSVQSFRICKVPIIKNSIMCNTYGKSSEALMQMGEDPSDPGGYFIIRGEWAVDCTENITFNQPKIYINEGYGKSRVRCEFISKPGDAYQNSEYLLTRFSNDDTLTIEIARDKLMGTEIPFYIIFRALGWNNDKDMLDYIVFDYDSKVNEAIKNTTLQAINAKYGKTDFKKIYDQQAALRCIVDLLPDETFRYLDLKNKPENYHNAYTDVLRIFDTYCLPHIGMTAAFRHEKLKFLGLLIRKVIMVHLGYINQTDRDSYRNKRVHAAGDNYAKVFKTYFNQTVVMPIKRRMVKDFNGAPFSQVNLANLVRSAIYADDFERLIVQTIISGNKASLKIKKRNVVNRLSTQLLNRKNQLNMLATMRQVSATSADSAKQSERASEMRRVHMSQIGYICLAHSPPEGEKVGINKQMAIFASIAPSSSSEVLRKKLSADEQIILEGKLTPVQIYRGNYARVFVNGYLIGYAADSIALVNRYRKLRRQQVINCYTTIYWDNIQNEVQFFVDIGRMTRPLIIVYNTVRDGDQVANQSLTRDNLATIKVRGGKEVDDQDDQVVSDPDNQSVSDHVVGDSDNQSVSDQAIGSGPDDEQTDERVEINKAINNKQDNQQDNKQDNKPNFIKNPAFEQGIGITRADIIALYSKTKTIDDLVREQKVEYITPEEQENCYVCASFKQLRTDRHDELKEYTHCDIPQSLLGLTALTAPFGNHNQAPRVTYQTSQVKQTCGYYSMNWPFRMDKETFLQYTNETPLIRTAANKYIFPNGNNVMVAMACYTGYNQEDSLIINKAAIDRGLFDGSKFTYYKTEFEQKEELGNPDVSKTEGIKTANYEKLVNGVVQKNTRIVNKDVLIGKTSMQTTKDKNDRYTCVDRSIVYKDDEEAIVHDRIVDSNEEGMRFCKVSLRKIRPVAVGDKFCLTAEHKVLTVEGWKQITEVTTADTIATLNPTTDALEWHHPIAVTKFIHQGEIYHVKNKYIDLTVTNGHKMYAKLSPTEAYHLTRVDDLPAAACWFKRSCENQQPNILTYNIGRVERREVQMDAWLKLAGLFYSHGELCNASITTLEHSSSDSLSSNTDSEYEDVVLSFSDFNVTAKGIFDEAVATLNLQSKTTTTPTNNTLAKTTTTTKTNTTTKTTAKEEVETDEPDAVYYITDLDIIDSMRQLIGTTHRKIPEWCFRLGPSNIYSLLSAIVSKSNKLVDNCTYVTSSKREATDVQLLAILNSSSAEIKNTDSSYEVRINRKTRYLEPKVMFDDISITTDTEYMYGVEVPNHIFMVKHNYKYCWTGNSSRSGQKGIAALLMRESDMPFTKEGIRPALIFNPHGMPSRMTVAQLIESLLGNVCAIRGTHHDATMFKEVDIESIATELEQHGFNRYGYERMISGITGEYIDMEIYFGPTFYQRLQKFVADAEYSVRHALTDAITFQPLDGQGSGGGLKIGEMERDVLSSHGASRFLQEKFFYHSDKYTEYFCRCGKPATVNHADNVYKCRYCADNADITAIPTSWTAKLFRQEMESINVGIRAIPRPRIYETADDADRTFSTIDTYNDDTLKELIKQTKNMIDDGSAAIADD